MARHPKAWAADAEAKDQMDLKRTRLLVAPWTRAAVLALCVAVQNGYPQGSGPTDVTALAIDPSTPATLYAGTGGGGVFKSLNGGNNWTAINSGLTALSIQALAVDPSTPATLYAGTAYGTAGGGVFKSTNGGTTWQPTGYNLYLAVGGGLALAINRSAPATLYAGTYAFGVFKSTNGGTSWTGVNSGLPANPIVYALAIDPVTPATLYAGTDSGVFKSTNGGTSWNPFNSGLAAPSAQALAIDPTTPATLYAGAWNPGDYFNSGGVFKSTNGGNSWTGFNSGVTAADVQALAIDPATPGTLYAGTIGSYVAANSVFKSTNAGTSWTAASSGLPAYTDVNALAIDPSTPTTLYVGTGDLYSGTGAVFKSTDRGTTWQLTGTGTPACAFAISPSSTVFYYPGGASGGTGTVTVTAGSGCAWTATSNSSFLTITSGSSGSGNGTVGFSVAANSSTALRTGTLTIAGQTFTVTQAGTSCTYAISPANRSFSWGGGTGSVSVTTGAICQWNAASNDGFLSIIGSPAGINGAHGNGSLGYSVGSNFSGSPRTGTLTIAGQTHTVTQGGPPAIVTTSPLPQGTVGVSYSQALSASGGVPPYTWSITSGALPGGLTLAGSGVISGIPTTVGAYSFTVRAADSVGYNTATFSLTVTAPPALAIATTTPLLSGWVGGPYSQAISATGGVTPYSWSVTSGSLPGGLTLSSAGVVAGTPAAAGVFNFTVQVKDAAANLATKGFTLTTVAPSSMNRVGVLSQVASGGGWDTAIWLTNSTASPVSISLKFHGDAGNDMSIAYAATQEGDTEAGSGAALNRVINPNTTLVVATGSGVAANSQGWAEVLATGAVSGFAVFRYAPQGFGPQVAGFVTPWEGTVPLQTQLSATTMVLPFDNTGGFSTGFALGNLTAAQAVILATLYDESGSQLGSTQSISLNAYGHMADMVGTRWAFSANKRGIISFAGPAMTGLGLRASPYGALTSAPVALPGSLNGMGVLSQVASGGNWDTAIWLTNSSSAAIPVQLKFHGDSGGAVSLPYTVTQEGVTQTGTGSTLNRTIDPSTTLVLETGQGVSANVQGWAEVDATGALSGFAVFRYASQGLDPKATGFVTPWEGTVPLQTQVTATTMVLPFDNTGGFSTGFALGNLTAAQAVILATLYDESGSQLGSTQSISLNAYGHMADMVGTRWAFSANKRGIVKFTGAPMMGLGLRASPYGTLTSVPTDLQ